jgi:VWFA-related protein
MRIIAETPDMMSSILLAAALLAPQAAAPAPAEEPRTVTVTVTDDKGQPVESLEAQDVAVLENGAARTLTRVERDRRPLRLAVVVDTSQPMSDHYRSQMLEPVLRLLGRLPEGTQFAVWTTGDRPKKVVEYGDGVIAARRALERVFPQGGNTLLDALVEASRDLQEKEAGRSAIVVVTGTGVGFANYSKEQVVDIVRPSGATVLAAEIEETEAAASRAQGEVSRVDYDYVLSKLADATGGRRDILLSAMGTSRALESFAGELSSQYRLTFDSVAGLKDKDRKVEVKVARPGAKVRIGIPRS